MRAKSKEVRAHTCGQTKGEPVPQGWDYAIAEAKRQIADAQVKIQRLGHSIKTFEEMRDSGEPWPGTGEVGGGAKATASKSGS